MSTEDSDQSRWFAEEVQAHEASLRLYLRGAFPWLTDVDDLIQESFARLWRIRQTGPQVRSGKALLFTTAKHVALDLYRKKCASPINPLMDWEKLSVLDDSPAVPEVVSKHQDLEILMQAIQALPDRCRQVLTLRKIYGLSQKQIAAQLGIAEHTVEVQVANGMRRCAEYMRSHADLNKPDHVLRR